MERFWGPWFSGLALGMASVNLAYIALADTTKEVREVQIHNEQIKKQLETSYLDIGRLVLDEENGTYTFHTTKQEKCEGTFEVEKTVAKAVGKLSCTHDESLTDESLR